MADKGKAPKAPPSLFGMLNAVDSSSTAWKNSTSKPTTTDKPIAKSFVESFAGLADSRAYATVLAHQQDPTAASASMIAAAESEAGTSGINGAESSTSTTTTTTTTTTKTTTTGGGSRPRPVSTKYIQVSKRQKGNPILDKIKAVSWKPVDGLKEVDFDVGDGTGVLYLSVRYHATKPKYYGNRLTAAKKSNRYRRIVTVCQVDCDEAEEPLAEINVQALRGGSQLVVAWSPDEVARYLETAKAYESRSSVGIRASVDSDYFSKLVDVLGAVRRVNRTDAVTLGSTFGSLSGLMGAGLDALIMCPGTGMKKAQALHAAFHGPLQGRPPSRAPVASTHSASVQAQGDQTGQDEQPGKRQKTS